MVSSVSLMGLSDEVLPKALFKRNSVVGLLNLVSASASRFLPGETVSYLMPSS